MITVKSQNLKSISQNIYNNLINSLDFNLISCTCGHSGCLTRHGSYKRRIQLPDAVITLSITRVRCSACGCTHAVLLSSMVPYSQIPLHMHVSAIQAYESKSSLDDVLCDQSSVDENNLRSIIRSFRRYWKQRLLVFSLQLSDAHHLISECFSHFSRQFMQIKSTSNKLFIPPT